MEGKAPQNERVALIHWLSNWALPYAQKILAKYNRNGGTEMWKKGKQERISNFLKCEILCNIIPYPQQYCGQQEQPNPTLMLLNPTWCSFSRKTWYISSAIIHPSSHTSEKEGFIK